MLPHLGFGEANAHVTLSTGIMKTTVAFHDEVDVTEWLLYANPTVSSGGASLRARAGCSPEMVAW